MSKAPDSELPKTLVALLDATGKLSGQSPGWQLFLAACGAEGRERLLGLIKQAITSQTGLPPVLELPSHKGRKPVFYTVDILPLGSDGSQNILLLQQTTPDSGGIDWKQSEIPLLGIDSNLIITNISKGLQLLLDLKTTELVGKNIDVVFTGFEMGFLIDALETDRVPKEGEVAVVQRTDGDKRQWSLRYLGKDAGDLYTFLIALAESPTETVEKHHNRLQAVHKQLSQMEEATSLDEMLAIMCDLSSKIVGGNPVAIWINPHFIADKLTVNQKATKEQHDYFYNYCRSNEFIKYASDLLGFNVG
jgi:hypothetical protein